MNTVESACHRSAVDVSADIKIDMWSFHCSIVLCIHLVCNIRKDFTNLGHRIDFKNC
jgi:hypothetical protein